jgi:hypothetical protein
MAVRFQTGSFVQKYLENRLPADFFMPLVDPAPGGFWANLGRTSFKNQAGVLWWCVGTAHAFDNSTPMNLPRAPLKQLVNLGWA